MPPNHKIGSFQKGSPQLRTCPSSQCQKWTPHNAEDCVHCGISTKCSKCSGPCSCLKESDLCPAKFCVVREAVFQHQSGKSTPISLYTYDIDKYDGQVPCLQTQAENDTNARDFRLQCSWYNDKQDIKIGCMYGRFPETDETKLIEWAKSITNVQLCFQEMIKEKQRVWLDIETKPGKDQKYTDAEWDVILKSIMSTADAVLIDILRQTRDDATFEQLQSEVHSGWVIYESHGKFKRSNHLIHSKFWFHDHHQSKHFQLKVQQGVDQSIAGYVDPCANKARPLRIAHNYKFRVTEADELRPLIISSNSPVKRDLLVTLPNGSDELYRLDQVLPVAKYSASPKHAKGIKSVIDANSIESNAQQAFRLLQTVINPLGTYQLEMQPDGPQIYRIIVQGKNAEGHPCLGCDATHAHSHGNANWFMTMNDEGWWSVTPCRDTKKHLQLGPSIAPITEAPKDITTVVLDKHEKLFMPYEREPIPDPPPNLANSNNVKEWLTKCGFPIANDIDGKALLKMSVEQIKVLAPIGTDPARLHYIISKARSGSSLDWNKHKTIVVESLCDTMKTRRLKEVMGAYCKHHFVTFGTLPKIIFITVRRPQTKDFCNELSSWFEEWTTEHFPETIKDGFKSYLDIADNHEAIRNTDRLVIQVESVWKLLQAMKGTNGYSANQLFKGVIVMDEITSIAKQLSSTTVTQLNAVTLGIEQLIKGADVRLFLDLIIDSRTWDIVKLAPKFQSETILYRNTFKLNHAVINPREAFRVPTEQSLEAGALQNLQEGNKTAFVHSSKTRLGKFALQVQSSAQQNQFTALVYTGSPTYLAVTTALTEHMTEEELSKIKQLPKSRVGIDVFGYIEDPDNADDGVPVLNTQETLKDVKRWWNMPTIRFTGWTSTITVGISNSLQPESMDDEWTRVYVAFRPKGPTVRDLIQSHWRHRRAGELFYSITTPRQFGKPASFNAEKTELEILRQLSVACEVAATPDQLKETLWSPNWTHQTADCIKFIQNDTAKKLQADWFALPKWLQSVIIQNLIEEKRTNLLLEVEVQRYIIDVCGYTMRPLPPNFPTVAAAAEHNYTELTYESIPILTDEDCDNIKAKISKKEPIDAPDMLALRRHQFDNQWLPNATHKERSLIFDHFIGHSTDTSNSICNYDNNADGNSSPQQIFYQVMQEMLRRNRIRMEDEDGDPMDINPLHINPFYKRLDCVFTVCRALGLQHSQDTETLITPEHIEDIKTLFASRPDVRPSKLWGNRFKSDRLQVFKELDLMLRRWSGMSISKFGAHKQYKLKVYEKMLKRYPDVPLAFAHLISPKPEDKACIFLNTDTADDGTSETDISAATSAESDDEATHHDADEANQSDDDEVDQSDEESEECCYAAKHA